MSIVFGLRMVSKDPTLAVLGGGAECVHISSTTSQAKNTQIFNQSVGQSPKRGEAHTLWVECLPGIKSPKPLGGFGVGDSSGCGGSLEP